MRMAMFSGAAVVFLCAHTVFGFGMLDFLRAARQEEAHHFRRSLTSPVNAIVEVIQGAIDSDENGEVSMAEVGAYIDRYFNPSNEQPFTPRSLQIEGKGYMLTLASLIDTNGDGKITTSELLRAAEILVNNAGDKQVGRILEIRMDFSQRMPSYSFQTEARKAINVFVEATDSNGNGEITQDEMGAIFSFRRLRWYAEESLSSDFENADENSDGNLNIEEAAEFLLHLQTWILRSVLLYLEIYQRVGREIAEECINTGY